MASNIIPIEVPGVGAEAARLDEVTFDADGNPPPFEELALQFGDMQAFLILLELDMASRLRTPRTRGYPPRVFISYRRESVDHVDWCLRLADAIERAGYVPLIDERSFREGSMEELASFISTMVEADICIVVATTTYAGDGQSMRNWLFEEWERIRMLDRWGLTEVVIVDRDGSAFDLLGVGTIPLHWGVVDLSGEPDGVDIVARHLGAYDGLVVPPADAERLGDELGSVLRDLAQDTVSAAALSAAELTLRQLDRWSGTEEHRLARTMLLLKSGHNDDALSAALELLQGDVTIPNATWLLVELWKADLEIPAFPHLAELAEEPSLRRSMLHAVLAEIFEALGADVTAAGHCAWCIAAVANRELNAEWGWTVGPAITAAARAAAIWERLGQPDIADVYRRISSGFDREAAPAHWLLPLWEESMALLAAAAPSCRRCGAVVVGAKVCIRCAAGVSGAHDHCPLCEFPTAEPHALTFCPVCRFRADGGRVLFNDREPGARWSVLPQRPHEERVQRGYRLQSVDVAEFGLSE